MTALLLLLLLALTTCHAFVTTATTPRKAFAFNALQREEQAAIEQVLGGDFAGLSANFDASTGNVIPVPDHLIPESMKEWGSIPTSMEQLVSESLPSSAKLERQVLTIMPEVGCGVDNLETTKAETVIGLKAAKMTNADVCSFDYSLDSKTTRAETIFLLPDGKHRVRVLVDLKIDAQSGREEISSIATPMTVVYERKHSFTSSGGTLADGGGLTGSSVSEKLGPKLRGKPFSDLEPLEWRVPNVPGLTVVQLAGNVTVAYNTKEGLLDVVYVAINDKGEGEKKVVRRVYNTEHDANQS